jgi:hypothetical protein
MKIELSPQEATGLIGALQGRFDTDDPKNSFHSYADDRAIKAVEYLTPFRVASIEDAKRKAAL